MPSDSSSSRLPPEALDAFLDGILAELSSPTDPAALDEVRAAFRRRVPFSQRSYAAAALILRAAGLSRGLPKPPAKEAVKSAAKESVSKGKDSRETRRFEKEQKLTAAKDARKKAPAPAVQEKADAGPRPRFEGEGTTLFFSMGKRQRFYPRALIDLLMEKARLALQDIGEVRSFDNYTFADVDPARAQAVVAALDGKEVRGRRLSVNLAKKRDGEAIAD